MAPHGDEFVAIRAHQRRVVFFNPADPLFGELDRRLQLSIAQLGQVEALQTSIVSDAFKWIESG